MKEYFETCFLNCENQEEIMKKIKQSNIKDEKILQVFVLKSRNYMSVLAFDGLCATKWFTKNYFQFLKNPSNVRLELQKIL